MFVRIITKPRWLAASAALLALIVVVTLWENPWAMTVCAAVVLAGTMWALRYEGARYWTGRFLTAHAVFLGGAVVLFSERAAVAATVAALVVGVAVGFEGALGRILPRVDARQSSGLADHGPVRSLVGVSRMTHAALSAVVVAVLVGATFGVDALAVTAAVTIIVIEAVWVGVLLGRGVRNKRDRQASYAALEALAPTFYLHWDAPAEGVDQVAMWVPYLKRVGVPFAIVVRTPAQLRSLSAVVDVPMVLCTSSQQVEQTIVPSLRAVVFVNNALRNAHYLRFNAIRSIQLNHGDSDKPVSASRQFRAFDRNLVAGQAAVDRFAHFGIQMPRELVRIVGRPQVEQIARATARRLGQPPVVLYAPTWGGYFADTNLSSLPYGVEIVEELIRRGCTVIFRAHVFTRRNARLVAQAARVRGVLAEDRKRSGRPHLYGAAAETDLTVFDCMNACDAMIADVSSIVSDFLYSEKPFAMASNGMPRAVFAAEYPVARAAYLIDADAESLSSAVDAMLGDDPLREERIALRRYYLGDFSTQGYADVFVQALREELAAATTR